MKLKCQDGEWEVVVVDEVATIKDPSGQIVHKSQGQAMTAAHLAAILSELALLKQKTEVLEAAVRVTS